MMLSEMFMLNSILYCYFCRMQLSTHSLQLIHTLIVGYNLCVAKIIWKRGIL